LWKTLILQYTENQNYLALATVFTLYGHRFENCVAELKFNIFKRVFKSNFNGKRIKTADILLSQIDNTCFQH